MCAVGVQEGPGQICDRLSSPVHNQTRFLCDNRYLYSLQILFMCILQKLIRILRSHDNGHTFLRFGDRKLRSVKTRVLLGNLIQINLKSRSQLSDGNRNTACAEIVALLDDMTDLRTAEHTLKLSLRGSVTLLNLCSAGLQ